MPWVVRKHGETWAVYKEGADGEPMGDALGEHDSEEDAKRQQRALYASESKKSICVKAVEGSEDEIEGYGMPFGGPFNGSDVQGERFTSKTDFAFDWFSERPLIYHHGLDVPGIAVVGRVKAWETQADGVWVRAQLNRGNKFFSAIKRLIEQGGLYFSSGSLNHLAKVEKSGEITRWPWIELSLTPTPANPTATLDFATATAHLKAADLDASALKAMSEKQMRSMASAMASEMDMEISDEDMATMMASLDAEMPEDEMRAAIHKKMQAKKRMAMGEKAADLFALLLDDDPAANTALAGLPITTHAEITAKYATSLLERTKDLQNRRVKEGRVLSGMNRKRIRECMDAMDGAMTALHDLYDSTEPQPAKAASVRRVQAQMQALRIQALALS